MQRVYDLRKNTKLPPILREVLSPDLWDAVDRCPAPRAEELRIHLNRRASVTEGGRNYLLPVICNEAEMERLLRTLSNGSLYAHSQSIMQGYLTYAGGIRVGVCGCAATEQGRVIGVGSVTGLILRLPHPPRICTEPLRDQLSALRKGQGLLLYSPPGGGKTTLLRCLAAQLSRGEEGLRTVAVDPREELAPWLEGEELLLDVLTGYPTELGIEIAVRTLGAQLVICDEIGNPREACAVLNAANCGVPLVATTHASSLSELLRRPSLLRLHRAQVFAAYVGLKRERGGLHYRIACWEEAERLVT